MSHRNAYMTDELQAIYDQTVEFVAREVTPHGDAWEEPVVDSVAHRLERYPHLVTVGEQARLDQLGRRRAHGEVEALRRPGGPEGGRGPRRSHHGIGRQAFLAGDRHAVELLVVAWRPLAGWERPEGQ